jgi:hypothetical protein
MHLSLQRDLGQMPMPLKSKQKPMPLQSQLAEAEAAAEKVKATAKLEAQRLENKLEWKADKANAGIVVQTVRSGSKRVKRATRACT